MTGRLIVLLAAAVILGFGAAMATELIGHEVLVAIYGEDLAPIDDTPPMFLAVATSYLAGVVVGLLVAVIGWRRFVRR